MVLVFLIIGLFFDQRINHQQLSAIRHDTEPRSIKLEQRIARIAELERTRNRLLSRKQIIESLQASRSLTVEMLDKLAKTIPWA